jgi:2,4-dienoyl-CoA reductase-like NADH-dependent reductase (Old Yellow Enzyme family)/thioredoxin reductase
LDKGEVRIMKYARLFEPCTIGNVEIPNRIAMPPCTTNLAREGFVSDCTVDYYAEIGRGGVGLIIVEDSIVDSSNGRHTYNDLLVDDDKYIPGLRRLAQAIRAGGAKAALNLSHAGTGAGRPYVKRGMSPVAPSAIPDHPGEVVPRELRIEEIVELEDKFAEAALRAREAGFDVLSLHGAHGYLIYQFISPTRNHRQDIYGGDLTGRMRFLLEIIRKTKAKVGDDYPILVRIAAIERAEGGHTLDDGKEISRRLEAAGIDCISASVDYGLNPARRDIPPTTAPMRVPRACYVYLATALKEVVSIPVMTANRIVTPQLAEEILEQGKADIIGIGRGVIADPEWAKKAIEGRELEIRHCIACQYCLSRATALGDIRCAVNVAAGREAECRIAPATVPKTIFIAGGGPAGLEAARVATLRGHKVHLFEKEKLGGQLNLACIPPGKAEVRIFLDFEERQINQLGVKVENQELTPEAVKEGKPDAVVVATGARPLVPSLPGVEKQNVCNTWQVLRGEVTVGDRVVIIGGGEVGAETANHLAAQGKRVTIVEMMDRMVADGYPYGRELLLFDLAGLGVDLRTSTTAKEITDDGVVVDYEGKQELVKADTVVLALGTQPNNELFEQLKGIVDELYTVGDCAEARKLANAVEEGFKTALKL